MTIGIAASGPGAATCALRALRGVETLGSGSIGGFAVLAVMNEDGRLRYAQTQNGGSSGLCIDADWLSCERAAIISSGPDRPEPLRQFLPGLDGVGLVTGHRLPNRPFADSRLNLAVLARLQSGLAPDAAIGEVFTAYPECDAGLMALTADGRIAYADSARVRRRKDIHSAAIENAGSSIAVMMNSIHFPPGIGEQAADIIGELALRVPPSRGSTGARLLGLADRCPVVYAEQDRVIVDLDTDEVVAIRNADPLIRRAEGRWPVIQNGCPVYTTQGEAVGVCLHDLVGDVRNAAVNALCARSAPHLIIGAPQ